MGNLLLSTQNPLPSMSMNHPLWNTVDYTPFQLVLFGVAALFWVVAYILIIRDVLRSQYVGIPAAAVVANFAWESLWSSVFYTNMGALFEWGYRIWWILDLFIVGSLIRYGAQQVDKPMMKKWFTPAVVSGILIWLGGIYFFTVQWGNPIGANTAYIVNAQMSILYLILFRQKLLKKTFRRAIAWCKMLGTALTTVFCFMVWPNDHFMLYLGVICFGLDMVYIYWVFQSSETTLESLNSSETVIQSPTTSG